MTDQYHTRAFQILSAAFLCLLLALLLGQCAGPVDAQPARLGDCLPGLYRPVYGTRPLSDTDMAALRALPATGTFWRGYDSPTPFDIPADNTAAGDVRGYVTADGRGFYDAGVSVFVSPSVPGVVYALVYADLTPDAPGAEHEGTHPCAAVTLDAGDWQEWRARVGVGR